MLKLRVEIEGREALHFSLFGQDAVVGRAEHCDIVLDEARVSKRHGIFRATGGGYSYTDLGSRNGSALIRAGAAATLPSGSETPVTVGDTVVLAAQEDPVRIAVVAGGVAPFAPTLTHQRTVLASTPLVSLGQTTLDPLLRLAATASAAPSAQGLAAAALAFIAEVAPGAHRAAVVVGAGFACHVGDPIPAAIEADARRVTSVELFAAGSETAVAAPLIAAGVWHGALVAWGPTVPAEALDRLAIAAALVAAVAAALAIRLPGVEERVDGAPDPIGTHPAFARTVKLCRDLGPSNVPVLVTGETGSGKEVLARLLHACSKRASRPFVALNCAAVPDSLLESELFGHVRGAFTGATSDRRGVFEQADGGTLLLDEVGEMPLRMQAKLLRVLEDGEVRRVGSERSISVDVRLVSATHRDLAELASAGGFRSDLFYRLNAVQVAVPPLRARSDDVIALAHHFLAERSRREDKAILGFSREALWALVNHDWPGNVRELRNEVARAVALTPEGQAVEVEALSDHLAPRDGATATPPVTLKDHLDVTRRQLIERALEEHGDSMTRAAESLGLSRTGLYKLMVRLGMHEPAEAD